VCDEIFVVFVHGVNIEKCQSLNVIVKNLIVSSGLFFIETPGSYSGIIDFFVHVLCLASEIRLGKKACVWQQRQVSRRRLPNSCLCGGSPGIY
jgi:hypothetical protein